MQTSNEHPYRPLYARTDSLPSPSNRDLQVACAVLIAMSAVQIASGAQAAIGALCIAGGVAGLFSTWRFPWTMSSSSS